MQTANDEAYHGASIFMMYVFDSETISLSLALTDRLYRPNPSLEKVNLLTPAGLLVHSFLSRLIVYS